MPRSIKAIVFDFDEVIFTGIIPQFVAELLGKSKDFKKIRGEVLTKGSEVGPDGKVGIMREAGEKFFSLIPKNGIDLAYIVRHIESSKARAKQPIFIPGAVESILMLKEMGYNLYIVTSVEKLIVERLLLKGGDELMAAFKEIVAPMLEIKTGNILLPKFKDRGPVPEGKGAIIRQIAAREHCGLGSILCVGDGLTDVPMFDTVPKSILVMPWATFHLLEKQKGPKTAYVRDFVMRDMYTFDTKYRKDKIPKHAVWFRPRGIGVGRKYQYVLPEDQKAWKNRKLPHPDPRKERLYEGVYVIKKDDMDSLAWLVKDLDWLPEPIK